MCYCFIITQIYNTLIYKYIGRDWQHAQSWAHFIKVTGRAQLIKWDSWNRCKWIEEGEAVQGSSGREASPDNLTKEHLYTRKGGLTKCCHK